MSWYVRTLLLNREQIKESVNQVLDYNDYSFYDCGIFDDELETGERLTKLIIFNTESDLYQDLLSVEMKISELIKNNLLREADVRLLNTIATNPTYKQLEQELNITRKTTIQRFNEICKRIAFFLGEHFTDDGFINYMEEKYNLSGEEIEKLRLYMEIK